MGILNIEELAIKRKEKDEFNNIEIDNNKKAQEEYLKKLEEFTSEALDEIVTSYDKLKDYFIEKEVLCGINLFGKVEIKKKFAYVLSINVEDNEHYNVSQDVLKKFKKYEPRIGEWQSCYIDENGITYMDNSYIKVGYNRKISGLIQVDRKDAIKHIFNRAYTRNINNEEDLEREKENIKSFFEHRYINPNSLFKHI